MTRGTVAAQNQLLRRGRRMTKITGSRMAAEIEVEARPESEFLGHCGLGRIIVQYWRSFEQLENYARAREKHHWPAWVDLNRRFSNSRGDAGIWHETCIVKPGAYEAVHSGMPPFGLSKAGKLVPATGNRQDACSQMPAAAPQL
jgi:Domain of unknown function (DUF4188)